eukprot:m.24007 g.24007  ORF g.24007 m.24007 type:complete len:60 (+) comp9062_c0_seq1:705-884(+)
MPVQRVSIQQRQLPRSNVTWRCERDGVHVVCATTNSNISSCVRVCVYIICMCARVYVCG